MNKDHVELARLLSGKNGPTRFEREAILDGALKDAENTPTRSWRTAARSWRRAATITAPAIAAAAAIFLVMQPRAEEFTSRSGLGSPVLETICDPGPHCQAGATLVFRVLEAPADARFLAAFGVRPDGAINWYFPSREGETSIDLLSDDWLTDGIRIGGEHVPGQYTVRAFLSAKPLTRAEIRHHVESPEQNRVVELEGEFVITP